MLEMFIFETSQLIEQLEQLVLSMEKDSCFPQEAIHEMFRIMHTIKGSAGMMVLDHISALAHTMEDIFSYLREHSPVDVDCSALSDLILSGVDFIKVELEKLKNRDRADGNASALIEKLKEFLSVLKENGSAPVGSPTAPTEENNGIQSPVEAYERSFDAYDYKAVVFFEEGCGMETVRAFSLVHNLKEITDEICHIPEDLGDNSDSEAKIRQEGFTIYFKSHQPPEVLEQFFMQTPFLRQLELTPLARPMVQSPGPGSGDADPPGKAQEEPLKTNREPSDQSHCAGSGVQSVISVSVTKLDKLMDLVGEMVIAEAMVIQNRDLQGLELEDFHKSARQLHKITSEIKDVVMSLRMVPLSATFHKMHRVVRDMCKKLDKEVQLEIIGEETEVDKNIIEHISDPLLHLVRNAVDHGIESAAERVAKGKPPVGTVTLEGKNVGSEVHIIVRDDGRGLDKEKILQRAREDGLLHKDAQEMSEKEIFNLIFLPGFSTKDQVSEFSGRGVGMDVVMKNIEAIGGSVAVDSVMGKGTAITLKIPLTLAIIDGMNVRVGKACYTIPTISIRESFRPQESDIIRDPDGNEMIMVRGQCYPIFRLHQFYNVKSGLQELADGIMIMIEHDQKTLCVFADELLGQQQVVVKALPDYIRRFKSIRGLAGCTLLGDGSIS